MLPFVIFTPQPEQYSALQSSCGDGLCLTSDASLALSRMQKQGEAFFCEKQTRIDALPNLRLLRRISLDTGCQRIYIMGEGWSRREQVWAHVVGAVDFVESTVSAILQILRSSAKISVAHLNHTSHGELSEQEVRQAYALKNRYEKILIDVVGAYGYRLIERVRDTRTQADATEYGRQLALAISDIETRKIFCQLVQLPLVAEACSFAGSRTYLPLSADQIEQGLIECVGVAGWRLIDSVQERLRLLELGINDVPYAELLAAQLPDKSSEQQFINYLMTLGGQ